MFRRSICFASLGWLLLLAAPGPSGWAQKPREKEKANWNYDGGIQIVTDGNVADGPCFRLTGALTAPEFFDNLRRFDTATGSLFRRGNDVVTEFPEKMYLSFMLYDQPCKLGLQQAAPPVYLTSEIIRRFRVNFAWKNGVELRPAKGIVLKSVQARPIANYASEIKEHMPQRFEWWFDFEIPGKGIPLTDSLVVVIHEPAGPIIARAAARM